MTKHKSYNNISFKSRKRKRFVQTLLYMMSLVRGSVTMLCGPALKEHYNDAKIILVGMANCYIYELDPITYLQNKKDITIYNLKNIKVKNINIIKANVTRFMDLDFCKTLISTKHIVSNIFQKMVDMETTKNKHIIVTFSSRGSKVESDIKTLCGILNIPPTFKRYYLIPGLSMYKHTDPKINAIYISYRDGMPMCSFSYQWV